MVWKAILVKIWSPGAFFTDRLLSNLWYKLHQIQNLNVSHLVLPLSLSNPLKPGVKSRMKM